MRYGVFKVLNPTPYEIVTGFDRLGKGQEYIFEPFEQKDMHVAEHVKHVCISAENKGLVFLDYNDQAKKIFPTFEDYKRSRAAQGLGKVLAQAELAFTMEQQAEAAAELGKHLIEKKSMNSARFGTKVKAISDMLAKIAPPKTIEKDKPLPEVPDWFNDKKTDDQSEPVKIDKEPVKNYEEYLVGEDKVRRYKNGRFMVNSKWSSKEKVEELLSKREKTV